MHDPKRRKLKLEKWCDDVDPPKKSGRQQFLGGFSSVTVVFCSCNSWVQAGLRPAAGCGIQVPEEGEQLERVRK